MSLRSALLVLVVALPGVANAERVKVAVVPGIAVNLEVARVDALAQDLADALRAELDVDTVAGLEVRRLLPAEGLPPDCVANDACVADVAHRLSAQQLLFVVMVDTGTGGAIQVDSTWVEPATKKRVSRPAIDIASVADARERFTSAAHKLLPDAPARPKPSAGGIGRMSAPIPRHFTTPAYVTAGATVVGLGLGLGLGLTGRSKYDACERDADRGSPCSQDRKDSIRRINLAADIGWVVAIGGTVATAILYATSGEESHLVVDPVPGGATVSASWSFW